MTVTFVDTLTAILAECQTAKDLVLRGASLSGIQLSRLRADGLDLEEADLQTASLTEVRWKACTLRDARLDTVDFTDAILRLCNFDRACATNARFVRTRLENSTANGAQFDGANWTGAVLTDTDFSRASFRNANMERVSASGACFRGVDFTGAKLRNADLSDTDLRGADFTNADLDGADLHGADLRGVVGDHPALQGDESSWSSLPTETRHLTETMAPIVGEVLRTAGAKGAIDEATAERLMAEAARYQGKLSSNAPSPDTMQAVTRVLGELGDDILPTLFSVMQQSKGSEPPAAIKDMILRLRDQLGLDEKASVDDILARLLNPRNR